MKQPILPEWTEPILGAVLEVHQTLGPGLLESSYQACLGRELTLRGILFAREVVVPLAYKGIQLDCGYRLDFVAQERVIIEVKAVKRIEPIHEAQLLTYLRLSGLRIGLLINFNVSWVLIDGVTRLVNDHA
jgi:GxxExxY protein